MGSRSSLPANGSRERAPDDRLREASISPRKSRVREEWIASSLALLGRNWGSERRPPQSKLSSPGLTGRSSTPRPLDLSQTPLEYWVARSSRAMTAVFVSSHQGRPQGRYPTRNDDPKQKWPGLLPAISFRECLASARRCDAGRRRRQ